MGGSLDTVLFGFIFISIIMFMCLFHKDTRVMGIWYYVVVANGILMSYLWNEYGFGCAMIQLLLYAVITYPKILDRIKLYLTKQISKLK